LAHSKNREWKAPELARFNTLEEVLAYYGAQVSPEELEKLDLLEQMRMSRQTARERTRRTASR
jgi:hypothetical protein